MKNHNADNPVEVPPTQEQSETPMTDKVEEIEGNWDTKALRMGHFARSLERELNEITGIALEESDKMLELANEILRLKRKLSRLEGMRGV